MNYLEPYIGDQWYAIALSILIILAASYLLGRALKFVLQLLDKRVATHTKTKLDNIFLETLGKYIVQLVLLFSIYVILKQLKLEYSDVSKMFTKVWDWSVAISYVVNSLFIGYVAVRFVRAVVTWYVETVAVKTLTHLDDELAPLVQRILNLLIFVFVIVIVLDHFQQDLSTIVVSLGVGTLAIALAAQDTLSNMIAGFVLMIDRPFRLGDRVQLMDGTVGNIKDIGIRTTRLVDDYHIMIIIPNAEIVKSQIYNLSYPNDIVRFRVGFGVAYGTDLDFMRKVVLDRINSEPDIEEPDSSEVRILEMGDSSMNAELLCMINNPNNIPRRKSDLLKLIYDTLYDNTIEIPFPQRVMHFGPSAIDAVKSRLESEGSSEGKEKSDE
jgi:MscS family membrane protein